MCGGTVSGYQGDLLQSQALVACFQALQGNEIHIYVHNSGYSWRGVRIDSESRITNTTHWSDSEGVWRYDVIVGIEVRRTLVKPTT